MRTQLLAGALFLSAVSFAQTNVGTLQGKVTDATTGLPLPNVNVIIMQDGQLLSAQGTSANGNYMYEKLYPNTFDVAFAVKGRQLENRTVTGVEIQAGMITTLNVTIGDKDIIAQDLSIRPDPVTNPIALAIVLPVEKKSDEVKEEFKGQYYPFIPEQDFVLTKEKANSTFSADVDNAFYTIVRRMIMHRVIPPQGAVRIEEMLNYFDYEYPKPDGSDISVYTESAACPWNQDHLLLHIGLQTREVFQDDLPPSHLVFLMDVSGSMATSDKLPLAKSSMRTLVRQLRPQDRVSIVTYRETVEVVAEDLPGSDKEAILRALAGMYADGSTAGAPGLEKAYDIAGKHFIRNGNNRIILCSDGDFNVGPTSDDALLQLVRSQRKNGVYLTVLGFGMDNLQDGRLELLADNGNGNYGYIDQIEEARKLLVEEMGGTLVTVARDVKLEATFDERYVKAWRLIGYENRALTDKEFDKRKTDAGEMGMGQTVTALYELIPADELLNNDGNMGNFIIRYRTPSDGSNSKPREIISPLPFASGNFEQASETFRFSAAVAEFGLLLRESPYRSNANLDQVQTLAGNAVGQDKAGYRADFLQMVADYRKLIKR